MPEKELSNEQIETISAALDRVVNDLPWGQSVFLSALGKKFEKIRDEFKKDIGVTVTDQNLNTDKELDKMELKPGQREIFVSVYNTQGTDLGQWARIISNLTNQFVSRPIYLEEESVKAMIRSKLNLINEGYVSLHVYDKDFMDISRERLLQDRLGNTLVQLKERVINQNNIKKFYHESGVFEYKKGIMTKIGEMTFANE